MIFFLITFYIKAFCCCFFNATFDKSFTLFNFDSLLADRVRELQFISAKTFVLSVVLLFWLSRFLFSEVEKYVWKWCVRKKLHKKLSTNANCSEASVYALKSFKTTFKLVNFLLLNSSISRIFFSCITWWRLHKTKGRLRRSTTSICYHSYSSCFNHPNLKPQK